nr:MAG TPA: hypothetical protein [Caudoviricetes sp.]
MEVKRITQNPAEQADDENLRANVKKQDHTIEKQKLLIRYLAEMTDVYIPEEEEEEDVQYVDATEENV